MLTRYFGPIKQAVVVFPLIAGFFTLPYLLHEYRKYGAILFLRTLMVYSFILYMMCAYFLIILPLPPVEEVAEYTSPWLQLKPFNELLDVFRELKDDLADFASIKQILKNSALFQIIFNILLTVPFGVYLRYFFKASRKQTVILSLALSLFYELTQLSGLYFIYPRPYRLADVDDVITNTLGGYLGYLIAPKLTCFLPSADRMKEVAYQRSEHVSILRRLFAAALDCMILLILFFVVMIIVLPLLPSAGGSQLSVFLAVLMLFGFYTLFVMLYFGVLEWLMGGRSPGKLFFHLKLVDTRTGGRPKLWQYLVRYGFFYLLVVPLPFLALLMFFVQDDGLALVLGIVLGALFLVLLHRRGGAVRSQGQPASPRLFQQDQGREHSQRLPPQKGRESRKHFFGLAQRKLKNARSSEAMLLTKKRVFFIQFPDRRSGASRRKARRAHIPPEC